MEVTFFECVLRIKDAYDKSVQDMTTNCARRNNNFGVIGERLGTAPGNSLTKQRPHKRTEMRSFLGPNGGDAVPIHVPRGSYTMHEFEYPYGENNLPEDNDTDLPNESYGDAIMQGKNGEFVDAFLGNSLTLIERIDACKHAAQMYWDNMLISRGNPHNVEQNMREFIHMQSTIGVDRLLLLGDLYSLIRDPQKMPPSGITSLPGVCKLTNSCDQTISGVTYRKFTSPTAIDTTDTNMVEMQSEVSCKALIEWQTGKNLLQSSSNPESSAEIIQGIIRAISIGMTGKLAEANKDTMTALFHYNNKVDWAFTAHNQPEPGSDDGSGDGSMSMPAWSYPRESRIFAGVWRCEEEDPGKFMEITVGAVSFSVFKKYYNPRVVECIKQMLLHSAMHWIEEEDPYNFANFVTIEIKIRDGDHVHAFSINPMHTAESCVVSHIKCTQYPDLEHDTNAGIIMIPNNLKDINPRYINPEFFNPEVVLACGAYKGVKLSEEKLMLIHAQKCAEELGSNFQIWNPVTKASRVQYPEDYENISMKQFPKAKVSRISKGSWDIITSSHLIASNEMCTVITVVNYPRFGTHIDAPKVYSHAAAPPRSASTRTYNWGNDLPPRRKLYDHTRGHRQERREPSSPKHLSVKKLYYIRAFFEGHHENDRHLLIAQWRSWVNNDLKREVLQKLFDGFEKVKYVVSRQIRAILDSDDGSDRCNILKSCITSGDNGRFFDFLYDDETQKEYTKQWILCIREIWKEYPDQYEQDDYEETPDVFSGLPFIFTTPDPKDRATFLKLMFPDQADDTARVEYFELMKEHDGTSSGLIQPDDSQHVTIGSMIPRPRSQMVKAC